MDKNPTNDTAHGSSTGGGAGAKIRGAWEVVHGAGESLRGNVLDFVDNLGFGNPRPAQPSHVYASERGTTEIQRGMTRLHGHGTASTGPGGTHDGVSAPTGSHPSGFNDGTRGASGTTTGNDHDGGDSGYGYGAGVGKVPLNTYETSTTGGNGDVGIQRATEALGMTVGPGGEVPTSGGASRRM
ncbi:hypothetical protein PUNSTDRAFT_115855 [Punctularia strigosozonata HHB-11173 SS5]|uniref:uncharacterized protein n=1 Tax=Punctularia strigosozonata (strain HHB-11173) TaxID=741275 RepID=UPI0004418338|nr:uncharacterized protein PUNSTDRAFT_115855 [Punctularia strigosozonata HHB-11173 SS5]EIN05388.1 hypothetical protein PUNSTDRAFT_115855 [Punctularia strigosozonata HHB-11173 SS5]